MSKSTKVNCIECLKSRETYKINETMVAELKNLEVIFFKYTIHLNIILFCPIETFRL